MIDSDPDLYNVATGHQQVLGPSRFAYGRGDIVGSDDGERYIDLYTNEALPLGHDLTVIRQAFAEDHPLNLGLYRNRYRDALAERLAQVFPGYASFQFYTSGTLANEGALRYAAAITGRSHFAGFHGAYHGRSKALASLGNLEPANGGAVPGFIRLTYPMPPDAAVGDPADAAIERLAATLDAEGAERFAGVMLEAVSSKAVWQPPDHWLARLKREVLEPRGILLVADEAFTSGRVGGWSAAALQGVLPDVITFSKCFSSGYPFAGLACLREHAERTRSVKGGDAASGQAMQCAVVLATLDAIDEQGLVARTRELERRFLHRMGDLAGRGGVARVSAKGALFGIAFDDRERTRAVGRRCVEDGVLVAAVRNVLRLTPALNVDEALLDEGLARIRGAIEAVDGDGGTPQPAPVSRRPSAA